MSTSPISDALMAALMEIARVRFQLFRERFGRDPGPDEPLLFDPDKGEPTAATQAEGRVQVVSAALASEVDANAVLGLLGYEVWIDA
ncbi:MAG: hypothetical protein JO166_11895 [Deltaproteobacteria bacterium]|nr:hypothetical protein [Deltaproteobacteria bacterium]